MLPALIRKAHEAKTRGDSSLTIWGTGTPLREFLFSEDLADACVFLMESRYFGSVLNIGSGEEISIRELANMVCRVIDFRGKLTFDKTKPDGTPRKLLCCERLNSIGWHPRTPLEFGIRESYRDFLDSAEKR